MGDECVVLLERVLAENNRLREAMEERDAENQRLLKKLCSKLDGENADPVMPRTKNNRKRTRNVIITQQCRQDFRKMYKILAGNGTFQGFVVSESFTAEENQTVTKTVIDAVLADHGGDKCPWSAAELRGAASTYFKSIKDSSVRAKKGKLEAHTLLCRRQGRMRDKVQRRLSILAKMPWSTEKKIEIQKVIGSLEYTSSDESDLSEDEDGNVIVSAYLVKKLPWERSALTNVKRKLDSSYIKNLTRQSRANFVARKPHPSSSTRRPPFEGLGWAVRLPSTTSTSHSSSTGSSAPLTPSTTTGATVSTSNRAPGTAPTTPSTNNRVPTTPSTSNRALGTTSTGNRPPARPPTTNKAPGTTPTPRATSTPRTGSSLVPRVTTPRTTLGSKKLKKTTKDNVSSPEY